ncbi:MAG: Coenzyme F420 hydrogenase/dehydrogenase, beta subunit C-terminal domain [Oscillospiraceae bacterium]|nr:Coenzyme F420 hydrogenase/dehydrogenase, beta subunit C-terminal domain [Oscillospiraceae bacterium]
MSKSVEREQCSGCGACANRCPSASILMEADGEGFLYPHVKDACKSCGFCASACPVLSPPVFHPAPETVLAAWHTQDETRLQSASGGFFRVLTRHTLDKGGLVFGAAFDGRFHLSHRSADSEDGCQAFSGSKYLQSDTAGTYREAKDALDMGRHVLYSGTPCQVAGLYGYLGGDDEKLLTCEVLCNGVPSPGVFADYLAHLERKHKAKAVSVRFKDKVKGWRDPHFTVVFDNAKRYSKPVCDTAYGHGFGAALFLRPVCGQCPYARPERCADFTLADFWALRRPLPDGAEKGVSLVLVNSEKATGLKLPPLYDRQVRPYAEAAAGNARLTRPLTHSPRREAFFALYQSKPFKKALRFTLPLYKRAARPLRKRIQALLAAGKRKA